MPAASRKWPVRTDTRGGITKGMWGHEKEKKERKKTKPQHQTLKNLGIEPNVGVEPTTLR